MANEESEEKQGASQHESVVSHHRKLTRGIAETSPRSPTFRIPSPRGDIQQGNRFYVPPPRKQAIRGYTIQINASLVSQMILPAEPGREFLFLQNYDPLGYATIAFGTEATLVTGIRLAANGGGILLDNHVPTAAIFIIGSIAANSNITLISG